MKIFGIGLEKTGTSTLGRSLEILGFDKRKGFDFEALEAYKQGHMDEVYAVAEEHDNFEHYPWALMYKELYERYPDAKFILTTRTSAFRWFNSLCHHARRTGPDDARQLVYGHAMPNLFETEDLAYYDDHVKNVHQFFNDRDSSRLLEVCWAKDDGWQQLCTFLNCPIPDEEFPHLNR